MATAWPLHACIDIRAGDLKVVTEDMFQTSLIFVEPTPSFKSAWMFSRFWLCLSWTFWHCWRLSDESIQCIMDEAICYILAFLCGVAFDKHCKYWFRNEINVGLVSYIELNEATWQRILLDTRHLICIITIHVYKMTYQLFMLAEILPYVLQATSL